MDITSRRTRETPSSVRSWVELEKDRLQREAVRRELEWRGIDHKSVCDRLNIRGSEVQRWFSGELQLSAEQVSRIVAIVTPSPARKQREDWADAAQFRILKKAKAEPNKPCVKRMLWLIEALRSAESLRVRLYEAAGFESPQWPLVSPYQGISDGFSDSQLQELNLAFRSLMNEIEGNLKRYRWHPTVRCGSFLGLTSMYTWSREDSKDQNWENWAVYWLIGQATQGSSGRATSLILRFRNCRQCQTLFYALTDHQQCCTAACRKKFHAEKVLSTPEGRAKHAADMKERRRLQREREARQDALLKARESGKV
jgi:hypothetical protein